MDSNSTGNSACAGTAAEMAGHSAGLIKEKNHPPSTAMAATHPSTMRDITISFALDKKDIFFDP